MPETPEQKADREARTARLERIAKSRAAIDRVRGPRHTPWPQVQDRKGGKRWPVTTRTARSAASA